MASVARKFLSVGRPLSTENCCLPLCDREHIVTAREFIFSDKRKHRFLRHASFWIILCISRIYLNYYPEKPANIIKLSTYDYTLAYMFGYLPVYMISVYVFIYFLVPLYLQKKKYPHFIAGAFVTGLFNFIACSFIAASIFNIKNTPLEGEESFYAPLRAGFYQGSVLVLSISAITAGFKLTKAWYLQQIENTKLAKLNSEKAIKLLKEQIQPTFLFQSLNTLREKIICLDDEAPLMVLQLSELLSYLLYDTKDEIVALQKELEMLKLLIAIEKNNKGDNLKTKLHIEGDEKNKYIIPLSLFSPLQNAFTNSKKERLVNVSVHIAEDSLNFVLANHINIDTEIDLALFKHK